MECKSRINLNKISALMGEDPAQIVLENYGTIPIGSPPQVQGQKKVSRKGLEIFKKNRGIFLALLCSIAFSLASIFVKFLHVKYNSVTISLWGYQGSTIPFLIYLIYGKLFGGKGPFVWISGQEVDSEGKKRSNWREIRLLIVRSLLTSNGLILHFYSLYYLNVGDATVIASSTPLLVTIFAHFFISEKSSVIQIACSFTTIFGVFIISRPPLFTSIGTFDYTALTGTGLCLSAVFFKALSMICLKSLKRVNPMLIIFAFGACGTIETLLVTLVLGYPLVPSSSGDLMNILSLVTLSFLGQMAMVFAMKYENAGIVSLVRTSDVIFAYIWQIFIFKKLPDIYSLIGASIVLMGLFTITLSKMDFKFTRKNTK